MRKIFVVREKSNSLSRKDFLWTDIIAWCLNIEDAESIVKKRQKELQDQGDFEAFVFITEEVIQDLKNN